MPLILFGTFLGKADSESITGYYPPEYYLRITVSNEDDLISNSEDEKETVNNCLFRYFSHIYFQSITLVIIF